MKRGLALAVVTAASLITACSTGTQNHEADPAGAPAVSEKQAAAVLKQVAAAPTGGDGAEFCKKYAYQVGACQSVWKEAAANCLKPADPPHVLRTAPVRNSKTSAGGRVVEVEGHTRGGQRYVSQVFVTASSGRPQSSIGVYWAGVGLDSSPLTEKNTVPQNECPKKKSTS